MRQTYGLKNLVLLLLAGLLLAACEQPKFTPLAGDAVIVAFGDSLTEGVGASKEASYPSQLARLTGRTVINAGVSGETTTQGLARFERVLERHQPQLVILLQGGNDILRNQNLLQTKRNLAQMIEIARARGVQVLLLGVPKKNLFSNAAGLYDELAEEYQLAYARELVADLLRTKKYKSDPIHLNAEGYGVLAEQIAEILQEEGALP